MSAISMSLIWIGVALLATVVEIATQQLVSIWFAVAGFITFVFAYLGFSIGIQLLVFAFVSAASFILIRRYLMPYIQTRFVPTNVDRLIGQEAVVTRELPLRGRGEVRVLGQFWTAQCDDPEQRVEVDQPVLIRAIEGATLIVSAIEEE